MVTTQSADNVLKSYYLSAVTDQLNKGVNPLLAKIRQTTADVWGRDVRKAVRYGVNGGIGAGTETGTLPSAGGNKYAQFVVSLKNLYGVIEISDKAIRASASNEGAFVNLLNDEMDGLVKSASFNFGRMLFGDGSGTLAKIDSVDTSNTTLFFVDSTRNLAEGMVVDVYNATGTPVPPARTVLSVDHNRSAVQLSGSTIATPKDYTLVMQGSKNNEITGLGAIFGSGTSLYGLPRSSNQWLNPVVKDSVGEISESVIQKAIDEVEERAGSRINFIVCSWGVRRALFDLIASHRTCETLELEGGFRAISFDGIPVVADRFCPEGTMYLLNTDDFALHQLCDWQWLEGEDGSVLRQTAGKPVFTATLVKYAELLCYRPAGQAMLSGIDES